MTRLLVISGALVGLTLTLLVQLQAQQQIRTIPAGNTPLVAENLVNDPVPKLADGTMDLTGPWQGGGSNADIEREGGLMPGELPAGSRPVSCRCCRGRRHSATNGRSGTNPMSPVCR